MGKYLDPNSAPSRAEQIIFLIQFLFVSFQDWYHHLERMASSLSFYKKVNLWLTTRRGYTRALYDTVKDTTWRRVYREAFPLVAVEPPAVTVTVANTGGEIPPAGRGRGTGSVSGNGGAIGDLPGEVPSDSRGKVEPDGPTDGIAVGAGTSAGDAHVADWAPGRPAKRESSFVAGTTVVRSCTHAV